MQDRTKPMKKAAAEKTVLRQSAEMLIADEDLASMGSLSREQMWQALHELKVYRVELEIQNEELRHAQQELDRSRAQYRELYEHAPLAYITLDENGFIEKANLTAGDILGADRQSLFNQPFTAYILPEDQDIFYLQLRKSGGASTGADHSFDIRMRRVAGDIFWAHIQLQQLPEDGCRLLLNDITGRKINESIMAASLKLSEYAVSHSLDDLLTKVVDEAEAMSASRVGFFHFLEPDQQTLKLQTWSTNTVHNVCSAEGKGQHYPIDKAGVWVECVKSRKPVIHNSYATLPDRKGLPQGHVPIERELVVPIFHGDLIVAIIGVGNKPADYLEQDIETVSRLIKFTWDIISSKQKEVALEKAKNDLEERVRERTKELVQAHIEMKKASFDLVWAEERERERIAGELHDQVGQSLLLAKLKLDSLLDDIPPDLRNPAEAAAALIENSIHDIRSLTFRLRPPLLDTAGIDTTLEWLCSSISNDYNLKVNYSSDGSASSLSAEIRYLLYQVVRELLVNVAKHAGTEYAHLQLASTGSALVVKVIDEGVGFKNSGTYLKHVRDGGYGLYNVQQRIERIGGEIAIESTPGSGTVVTITLPAPLPLQSAPP